MKRYVAFLRAINVGGNHLVSMEALRREFAGLGFAEVETFIASGNVIFSSRVTDTEKLAAKIERHLLAVLGYDVSTFVRTVDDVARIGRHTPFSASRMKTATALNVGFLSASLDKLAQNTVMALETPLDSFHVNGREIYWLTTAKQSESKISNAVLERALKRRSTFRGINTIVRLTTKLEGGGAPQRGRKNEGAK